jgi:predicted TIM-barrel fold metal-dependent hydrolase
VCSSDLWDSDFPDSAKTLRERADLGADAKAKILGTNAKRLFGL